MYYFIILAENVFKPLYYLQGLLTVLYLTGTGKGGTSIWGRKFEDEFSEHLKVWNSLKYSMLNDGCRVTVSCTNV